MSRQFAAPQRNVEEGQGTKSLRDSPLCGMQEPMGRHPE